MKKKTPEYLIKKNNKQKCYLYLCKMNMGRKIIRVNAKSESHKSFINYEDYSCTFRGSEGQLSGWRSIARASDELSEEQL